MVSIKSKLSTAFWRNKGYARAKSKDEKGFKAIKSQNKKEFGNIKKILRNRGYIDGIEFERAVQKTGYGYIWIPIKYWDKD